MAEGEAFVVRRWETPVSDVAGLYFIGLLHRGQMIVVTVSDQDDRRYGLRFDRPGPYRVVDEQLLVSYWNASRKGRGWTFQVTGAAWTDDLELLDHYAPGLKHYAIAPWDFCLEVLTATEPQIRVL